MKVLLVEPWLGGSHKAWAHGYAANSSHNVSLVSHEAQFWKWRLRGGAVTLAGQVQQWVGQNGTPDVMLVSDMVDVAELLGLLRGSIGITPVVLYMHENQLAFPRDDADNTDAAARNWVSMVAADAVVVNSAFHQDVIADGISRFVEQAPDNSHRAWVAEVLAKTSVVPVGVQLPSLAEPTIGTEPLILWNHRWDDDKQPDVFVRALERLRRDGVQYRVALAGEDIWGGQRMTDAAERLGDAVVHVGTASPEKYRELLALSDICVSVANHEFFGIAVVEAMAAGCVPVLPNQLSYPELVPAAFHDGALYPEGGFRARLAEVATDLPSWQQRVKGLAQSMERFGWAHVAPQLDGVLSRVVG